MNKISEISWPASDLTRVPYAAYLNPEIYQMEQAKIFRGPHWNYLALEAEIPNPGDFRTVYVGDTSVIVNRTKDGEIRALVNRCAHRGTIVRREIGGNAKDHTCCYHQWNYDLEGKLLSIPFRRGADGKGGLPDDFDLSEHCLQTLRAESYKGVIFGTFSDETEPLLDYLDTSMSAHLDRLMHKPIEVLGYQRQRIFGNWKLYTDNVRDPNHGGLLHMFQIVFGLVRLSHEGGAKLDKHGRHNLSYAMEDEDSSTGKEEYGATDRGDPGIRLTDMSILKFRPEYPDDMGVAILSIFPNSVFHQISNSLATRQIRTMGPDEFELFWTYYGYVDDDEDMRNHRLRQANLAGPGGFISMEDGEAIEIAHNGIKNDYDKHSVVEIGGRGKYKDQDNLVTEVPMRGFWTYYRQVMGFADSGDSAS